MLSVRPTRYVSCSIAATEIEGPSGGSMEMISRASSPLALYIIRTRGRLCRSRGSGRRRLSVPYWAVDVSQLPLPTTSLDDGRTFDVRIADTLEEFGFVGTIYASTGPERRRLISDYALARIGRKHELGVNEGTHTIIPDLLRQALAEAIHGVRRRAVTFRKCPTPTGSCRQVGGDHRRGRSPGNSAEPTLQPHPNYRKMIIRNCLYLRMIPTVTSLLELERESKLRLSRRKVTEA